MHQFTEVWLSRNTAFPGVRGAEDLTASGREYFGYN